MSHLVLQKRDLEILTYLYRHSFLLRDHLHALCFPEIALRRVTRRLKRLIDAELIVGGPLPLGAFPVGLSSLIPHPGQFAYRLGEKGARTVAELLEADITHVRRRLQSAPSYVGHAIAVASIAVAFRSFTNAQGYQVTSFLCEGDARYRYQWKPSGAASSDWKTEEIRPDGLTHLLLGEVVFPIHLEADMATQGRAALKDKLEGYAQYSQMGALQRRFPGASLHLGIVTTSQERAQVIENILEDLNLPALTGVLITTFEQLTHQGPLAPIWRSHTTPNGKGLPLCSV